MINVSHDYDEERLMHITPHTCTCMHTQLHVLHDYEEESLMYTGWRRLIGSPKLQIIFHRNATKYRSLLRKMTCKDKGSYESSPPCITNMSVRICVYMCMCTV